MSFQASRPSSGQAVAVALAVMAGTPPRQSATADPRHPLMASGSVIVPIHGRPEVHWPQRLRTARLGGRLRRPVAGGARNLRSTPTTSSDLRGRRSSPGTTMPRSTRSSACMSSASTRERASARRGPRSGCSPALMSLGESARASGWLERAPAPGRSRGAGLRRGRLHAHPARVPPHGRRRSRGSPGGGRRGRGVRRSLRRPGTERARHGTSRAAP